MPGSHPPITATELAAARAKYTQERERRVRPDGLGQYRRLVSDPTAARLDPFTERVERPPLTDHVDALVIGAGLGGLQTAIRLRQAGLERIRLIDDGGDVGGTWYWNRYPGVHCDIESYLYMPMLEEVGYVPRWRYAPGEEIRRHMVALAERFDLYRDAAFHTSATELRWDEDGARWHVRTDRDDAFTATWVVVSSGSLSLAKLPGIEGIEGFRGRAFHTSRWDYGYTGGDASGGLVGLADKRVAVVGTGATGIQVVPMVAEHAARTYVFQRTPATVDVRDNRPTDPEWAASLTPGWQQRRMDSFLAIMAGEPVAEDVVQDSWTANAGLQRKMITGRIDRSVDPAERERAEELLDLATMNRLRDRVAATVRDPETAEALKPYYRYQCKRPGFSDDYLEAFNRPSVTLVDTADTHGITRMTETGIVVGDREYEVDCVIFATGFETGISGLLSGSLMVHGRGGTSYVESLMSGFRTLHGFYSHGFPNLFQLSLFQNANSVNYSHILSEQARHIGLVVAAARSRGAAYVEPSREATEAWARVIDESANDNLDFLRTCTPGYYNSEGQPAEMKISYGPGPVAFHRLLEEWRRTSIDEVLVDLPPRRMR